MERRKSRPIAIIWKSERATKRVYTQIATTDSRQIYSIRLTVYRLPRVTSVERTTRKSLLCLCPVVTLQCESTHSRAKISHTFFPICLKLNEIFWSSLRPFLFHFRLGQFQRVLPASLCFPGGRCSVLSLQILCSNNLIINGVNSNNVCRRIHTFWYGLLFLGCVKDIS